ncbi:MAG: hypothetical protein IPF52_16620 [Saprospiraceae bacterium]|nr:hypothetical protein [Saprospiraceae bacterium]
MDDGNGGTDQDKRTVTVQATQTKITGSAKLEVGLSGDLVNSKVSIYKSISDWIDNIPVKFTTTSGAGSSVTYILNNVTRAPTIWICGKTTTITVFGQPVILSVFMMTIME